jgi:hypothetical protein
MSHSPEPWWWGEIDDNSKRGEDGTFLGHAVYPPGRQPPSPVSETVLFSAQRSVSDLFHHDHPYGVIAKSYSAGYGGETDIGISDEDARRLVACVNACAGVPTEVLEAGGLAEWIKENRV